MCYVPSWKQLADGTVLYVTDADVRRLATTPIVWADWTGHTALRQVYPRAEGADCEGWPCPAVIRAALDNGQMDKIAAAGENIAEYESGPLLTRLARDADAYMRWYVAQNPNTPPAVLMRLAGAADAEVRWYVAWNPNTPPAALTRLAKDADAGVRCGVAQNPQAPPAALTQLAKDADAGVRWGVARNPQAPPAVAEKPEEKST